LRKEGRREEAEKLYGRQSLSCTAIAEKLGVSEGTVYRWKGEAAVKGEATDWDARRRVYNMSPREMFAMYSETVKAWIAQIQKDPEKLSDGKIADVIAKHVSVLQKLDKRRRYLGVALDLIETANGWLAKNTPEIKAAVDPYWESIYQEFVKYSTGKGVLE
jgi:transposase